MLPLTIKKHLTQVFCVGLLAAGVLMPTTVWASDELALGGKVAADYGNLFSKDRLTRLGGGFFALGLVANSDLDGSLQNRYQASIRNGKFDRISSFAKNFGEGSYLIPLSILASAAYYRDADSAVGNWGLNTARSYAVGLPAMLLMQATTGASRPIELRGSTWRPFDDNNGVSGHAFVGAVPFLTLARTQENRVAKAALYLASGLTAWSRVNDDRHYTSQALLGWFMAFESVGAVLDTNQTSNKMALSPVFEQQYVGLKLSANW